MAWFWTGISWSPQVSWSELVNHVCNSILNTHTFEDQVPLSLHHWRPSIVENFSKSLIEDLPIDWYLGWLLIAIISMCLGHVTRVELRIKMITQNKEIQTDMHTFTLFSLPLAKIKLEIQYPASGYQARLVKIFSSFW